MRSAKPKSDKRSWVRRVLGIRWPWASRARGGDHSEDLEDANWRLNETAERFRDLLDTQAHLIVRVDAAGRVIFANRACAAMFGPACLDGVFVTEIIDTETILADDGLARPETLELTRTTLGERWISWYREPLPTEPGAMPEILLTGRDVSGERAIRIALREARDQAEAGSRAKSRFLAGMSHEIRTPMNGILGMSALLSDTPLNAEQRTYVEAVTTSARTLLALVDDILDFSKIEAGKLELQSRSFDLRDCVQSAVELLAPRATEKGLELVWRVDPSIPALLNGDDTRLRQILLNLLSNAVKFTDRGGVDVTVRRDSGFAAAAPGPVGIVITVQDTGIGLTQAEIDRLFVEFEQAGEGAQQRGGTGLGLAISDRLARAMGGAIRVESERGRGSRFSAHVLLQAITAPATRPSLSADGCHVLLALDGLMQRRVLAEVIAEAGGTAHVSDLARGLAVIAKAGQSGRPIESVIVSSDSDPVTCGELLANARRVCKQARGVVLIPASGRAILQDFRAQGFDRYLVTPVRPSSLLGQLGLTGPDAVKTPAIAGLPSQDVVHFARTGHVLIAEDNEINALLTRRLVERLGWTYRHVGNGVAAVEAVARSLAGTEPAYDAVLMDVFMPEMNGLDATKAIKAMAMAAGPGRTLPPVVALTANAFAEDKATCLAAGMDDYLAKPFELADLAQILQRHAGKPVAQWPRHDGAQATSPAA